MTTRNAKLLLLVAVACIFCYGNARRLRSVGDLALAIDIIDQEYVDKPDRQKLYEAAMKGMIDSLDPYSGYIPRESLKPFQAVFEQEFGGLGVSLDGPPRRDRLTVVATLFDSPAYRAGVKPGDVLLKINDEDTQNLRFDEVTKRLRGPEGTPVQLTLSREGVNGPFQASVVRARIEVESVLGDRRCLNGKWEYLLEEDPQIAYMRLELFGEKTSKELRKALTEVSGKCKGLILDLRDNTGGLLNAATEICDMFLDDGEIVSTRGRDGRLDEQYTATQGTEIPNSVPIAILVNDQSASASEILAACLQDRKRAIVVGQRSFGKGSVQNVIALDGGKAAMRLTTARYYPPSGRLIHKLPKSKHQEVWGVDPDPDCEVILSDDEYLKAGERFRLRADPNSNGMNPNSSNQSPPSESTSPDEAISTPHRDRTILSDPQLLKAIDRLQQKLHAE